MIFYGAYVMPLAYMDNTYGTDNTVGSCSHTHCSWSNSLNNGRDSDHTFVQLEKSDVSVTQLIIDGGPIQDFKLDYLYETDTPGVYSSGTDSEGHNNDDLVLEAATSQDYNLNNIANLTSESPELVDPDNYPDNNDWNFTPVSPAYDDWEFQGIYEFKLDGSEIGRMILGDEQWLPDVVYRIQLIHASPHKDGVNYVNIPAWFRDYGDAPDAGIGTAQGDYETTAFEVGPSHIIADELLYLGQVPPDRDDGTLQNATADADDNTRTDDEDGITSLPVITTSSVTVDLDVTATNDSNEDATLACWIDFNRDGDFTDTGERQEAAVSAGSGTSVYPLEFSGFATPVEGASYIRCRIAYDSRQVEDPTDEADSGEVEDFLVQIGPIMLGDYVWDDLNQNGIQDQGEPGVDGVSVGLFGNADCSSTGIGTTTTAGGGFYSFTNLSPGTYCVMFSNLPGGYVITAQNQGDDDAMDSDADPTTGKTGIIELVADDLTWDMGIHEDAPPVLLNLGDFVWNDLDQDGIQDDGEPGVEGISVALSPPRIAQETHWPPRRPTRVVFMGSAT